MKRILIAIAMSAGLVAIGGVIDHFNIIETDVPNPVIFGVSMFFAGMTLGISSVYEFKDVKPRKKELIK